MSIRLPKYIVWLALFALTSCGGGVSGENGDDPFGSGGDSSSDTANYTLALSTFDDQCSTPTQSFTSGQVACIEATLLQDGNPVQGEIVTFSGSLGTLSSTTKLTDSQGVAQITISSENTEIGAAELSATYDDASATQNYEYLSATTTANETAVVSMAMLNNGQGVNRFQADTDVQLQTQIVDENDDPIAGVIVTFSAQRGTLNTDSALTDSNGVAQVTLSATDSDIGAGVATAIAVVNDVDLASSLNYEIQAAGAISEQVIRLGYFDEDNVFIENQLGVSTRNTGGDVEISAGGTLGLSIALVDE
ncbi:MAG: Ig-like domain-containing protein, partial [Paraglaciecola chathamensis]